MPLPHSGRRLESPLHQDEKVRFSHADSGGDACYSARPAKRGSLRGGDPLRRAMAMPTARSDNGQSGGHRENHDSEASSQHLCPSGPGGNILVLTGRDGKVLVDAGFAVSREGILNALTSINADPIKHLINTHIRIIPTATRGYTELERIFSRRRIRGNISLWLLASRDGVIPFRPRRRRPFRPKSSRPIINFI
jgi:Metallo-beta-lactamase superfamily